MSSPSLPFSEFLYGDDVAKLVKEIQVVKRISYKVHGKFHRGNFRAGSSFRARGRIYGRGTMRARTQKTNSIWGHWSNKSNAPDSTKSSRGSAAPINRGWGKYKLKLFFCAGRLKNFPLNGKKITEDKIILDNVNNCHIEFDIGLPSQSVVPHSVFAKSEIENINQQINEFFKLSILKGCEFVED